MSPLLVLAWKSRCNFPHYNIRSKSDCNFSRSLHSFWKENSFTVDSRLCMNTTTNLCCLFCYDTKQSTYPQRETSCLTKHDDAQAFLVFSTPLPTMICDDVQYPCIALNRWHSYEKISAYEKKKLHLLDLNIGNIIGSSSKLSCEIWSMSLVNTFHNRSYPELKMQSMVQCLET